MENARRGAAIALGVMQDPLLNAIGIDDVGGKFVAICRQREDFSEPGTIESKGARGKVGDGQFLQVIVQEILDALIGGAEAIAQEAVFFARLSDHGLGDFDEFFVALDRHRRAADQGKLKVNVGDEMGRQVGVHI